MRKLMLYTVSTIVTVGIVGSLAAFRPRATAITVTKRPGDDTVVVNQADGARLKAMVLDQYDRTLGADTTIRYERIGGDSIEVSPDGKIGCEKRRDVVMRAQFATLTKQFVVRCRPVTWVEAASWIELMVGDSSRPLAFVAHGPDGGVVTELRGTVAIENGAIARLEGTSVRATHTGSTIANIDVGNAHTGIPIGVYESVTTFVNRPVKPMMGMHVALARGDTVEVPVPKAAFWVTYYSSDHGAPPTIELRGNGSCTTGTGIRIRRVEDGTYAKYCNTGEGVKMMIAHGGVGADIVRGLVTVRIVW